MGDEIAVHRHRAADVGGVDAGEDGAHHRQRLPAGDLRLAVVHQRVHELVDDAGAVVGHIQVVAGAVALHIADDDGGGRLAVYQHDALGAVQAGGLALVTVDGPAGRHGAQRAAGHPQDAQGVVVHADELALAVPLVQRHHLGGGLDDLLPQQILDQVHLVDAHIGQRAQRRLVFIEEPGALVHGPALGAGVAQHGAERDDIADDAAVQQLLGPAVHRIEAHVVADHQMSAVALGGGHHGLALRQRHGHGLFAQHMLAGVQRRGGDLRMAAVLHADGHRVDVVAVQQVEIGVADIAAVLGGHLLGTGPVLVVIGHDLRIGVGCILGQMAHLCDLAAADDTNSNHRKAPPLPLSTDGALFSFKL